MKDAATLLALADTVEALSGPDREVDREIGRAINIFAGTRSSVDLNLNMVPRYTASLDAAMALVPEGLRWCTDDIRDGRPRAFVEDLNDFSEDAKSHNGIAATPALALTAAALRAHAAIAGEG